MRTNLGFTLIELMIVLLLMSILAMIAYPNYMSYIHKSNRLDAMNSLFHYQGMWQQCLLQLPQSDTCLETIGLAPTQVQDSLHKHYEISAHSEAFVVFFSAKPVLNQINDSDCALFSLNSQGVLFAANNDAEETTGMCW